MRTTKIVAPLVAMALCTPNIVIAQEEPKLTTISGSTAVNNDFSLTRTISATNRNNSRPQDPKTIYVNPGDTINVKLDLQGKPDKANHGFTSFTEKVSPIEEFSANTGSLTVKKTHSSDPQVRTLDNLLHGTFDKTGKQTIEFKANSVSNFGELGNQVTINYSYKAGNEPGRYKTQFIPHENFAKNSSVFDAKKLDLTIVVNGEEENRPAPPDQGEQPAPPNSKSGTGFSWLTKALGVLAFLGGTVWFIIKHIFRL